MNAPISFKKPVPPPVVRPGISPAAIIANKIRHIGAGEAAQQHGSPGSGVLIPYYWIDGTPLNDADNGPGDFARIRLHDPLPDRKYHQRSGTRSHVYFPAGLGEALSQTMLAQAGEPLTVYVTEGEFKSVSLREHGELACGLGGITGAVVGGQLVPDLARLLAEWPINQLMLVGDSDVGINPNFAKAAVALARAVPLEVNVAVIAPGLNAPAKGCDDLRHLLGVGFGAAWEKLKNSAVPVGRDTTPDELGLTLLRREDKTMLRKIFRCESTD